MQSSAPGLAWDAALKVTNVEFALLREPDMPLMTEKGSREVNDLRSQISNRFARANTPYTGEAFDETKPTKRITCLDAKNIYRWAMCKPLPVRSLKWMTDFYNWRNSPCILEVDLEYLKELHDLHNNLKRTCVGT